MVSNPATTPSMQPKTARLTRLGLDFRALLTLSSGWYIGKRGAFGESGGEWSGNRDCSVCRTHGIGCQPTSTSDCIRLTPPWSSHTKRAVPRQRLLLGSLLTITRVSAESLLVYGRGLHCGCQPRSETGYENFGMQLRRNIEGRHASDARLYWLKRTFSLAKRRRNVVV